MCPRYALRNRNEGSVVHAGQRITRTGPRTGRGGRQGTMMMQSMGGRRSRTRCIRGSPRGGSLAVCEVRETGAGGCVAPLYHAIDALLVLDAPSRVTPRRTAPVRPPVGEIATRDRIHIITGGGDRAPFHTSHTV